MPHFRYRLLDYFKDRDCPKEDIILNITKTNSDVCLFRILLTITISIFDPGDPARLGRPTKTGNTLDEEPKLGAYHVRVGRSINPENFYRRENG